jgi:hypothetical protein
MSVTKECNRCGIVKPLRGFYADKRINDFGLRPKCKACFKEEYLNKILLKHNLTKDDYKKMLSDQNELCAICHVDEGKTLCIDHDHVTNKVRGLLCNRCNKGLGLLGDSLDSINSALSYLKGER